MLSVKHIAAIRYKYNNHFIFINMSITLRIQSNLLTILDIIFRFNNELTQILSFKIFNFTRKLCF